jgi:hypothetical protein
MSAVMSRWFGQPRLDTTGMRWARPASHMQHGVARGGMFYMSEDALGFQPRGIDVLFGARAVSWNRESVTGIELKPRLRKLRVTIVTSNGRDRLMVSDALVVFHDLQSWSPA